MAQITPIVSEALQRAVRDLLPSQQGFTEDLQAQNVIVPTIDLTPTAEGSTLPSYLQTALTLSDAIVFRQNGFGTTDVVNTPGFYTCIFTFSMRSVSSGDATCCLQITDGTTTKKIIQLSTDAVSTGDATSNLGQLVFCLSSGETFQANATSAVAFVEGSVRQIASLDGTLTNPTGFAPQ